MTGNARRTEMSNRVEAAMLRLSIAASFYL